MSPIKAFCFGAICFGLWSCDSGSGRPAGSPTSSSTDDSASIVKNNGSQDTSKIPGTPTSKDTTFVGRWRIYAIPADTVEFARDGRGKLIVDLGFRVAVDSFTWSAGSGKIHFAYTDGKTEDGTYKFFGKDSFNMTLPSLSTQLYLRLK